MVLLGNVTLRQPPGALSYPVGSAVLPRLKARWLDIINLVKDIPLCVGERLKEETYCSGVLRYKKATLLKSRFGGFVLRIEKRIAFF